MLFFSSIFLYGNWRSRCAMRDGCGGKTTRVRKTNVCGNFSFSMPLGLDEGTFCATWFWMARFVKSHSLVDVNVFCFLGNDEVVPFSYIFRFKVLVFSATCGFVSDSTSRWRTIIFVISLFCARHWWRGHYILKTRKNRGLSFLFMAFQFYVYFFLSLLCDHLRQQWFFKPGRRSRTLPYAVSRVIELPNKSRNRSEERSFCCSA